MNSTQEYDQYSKARESYTDIRKSHWNKMVRDWDVRDRWGRQYRRQLLEIYRFIIPPGSRVLELGCGDGGLLAGLDPSYGLGVDFSSEALTLARERGPHLDFVEADVHDFEITENFDFIILSDLLNDLWDVQCVLEKVAALASGRTRIVFNSYSRLWELPLSLARRLGLARPALEQNWLTVPDIDNMLGLAGLETVRQWDEILWPLQTPFWGRFCNRYLARLWPFRVGALTHMVVARRRPQKDEPAEKPKVSVVIPARNEAGNIEAALERVPEMGAGTEIIFVEGGSQDDTKAAIEKGLSAHPERQAKMFVQTGKGKGDAVRLGFAEASGDILMILDADLTVPPEDLPRFYRALVEGEGEFINGLRLVYPMEGNAMRFANLLGNKFFSLAFSWLLGQPMKDTLCGTKVLWKTDYQKIAANRDYFGDFDPFGDYDLIFGATKQNLKITGLPIRYRDRTYGDTNINRWSHGLVLLRMVAFAATRIKFF